MSNTEKKLLFAIMEYFRELQDSNSPLVVDRGELAIALSGLQSAVDIRVENKDDIASYSIKPNTLSAIFKQAVGEDDKTEDPEFLLKFEKYLKLLEGRGYFSKVEEGSPEYKELYEKAKNRFAEKYKPSVVEKQESKQVSNENTSETQEAKNTSKDNHSDNEEKVTVEDEPEKKTQTEATQNLNNPFSFMNLQDSNNPFPFSLDSVPDMYNSLMSNPQFMNLASSLVADPDFVDKITKAFQPGQQE